MRAYCEVEGCDEVLTPGAGSHGGPMMCGRCRQSSYYWRKKGIDAIKARKDSLIFWQHRIEYFYPLVRKIMNRARRRVAETTAAARAHVH